MTLVGGCKHGHLRQVNVGVEIINKLKRDKDICTMPEGMRRGARLLTGTIKVNWTQMLVE